MPNPKPFSYPARFLQYKTLDGTNPLNFRNQESLLDGIEWLGSVGPRTKYYIQNLEWEDIDLPVISMAQAGKLLHLLKSITVNPKLPDDQLEFFSFAPVGDLTSTFITNPNLNLNGRSSLNWSFDLEYRSKKPDLINLDIEKINNKDNEENFDPFTYAFLGSKNRSFGAVNMVGNIDFFTVEAFSSLGISLIYNELNGEIKPLIGWRCVPIVDGGTFIGNFFNLSESGPGQDQPPSFYTAYDNWNFSSLGWVFRNQIQAEVDLYLNESNSFNGVNSPPEILYLARQDFTVNFEQINLEIPVSRFYTRRIFYSEDDLGNRNGIDYDIVQYYQRITFQGIVGPNEPPIPEVTNIEFYDPTTDFQ